VQTALENLNLAQRQVESLKAQHLSAEAALAQTKTQLHQAHVNLERISREHLMDHEYIPLGRLMPLLGLGPGAQQ
jgi:multidrug resistance efflux pump